ncbi:hypothetical protein EVAR_26788_1 [Eumeta japonica]|uniref:Uncharacterized protein n=1 Tax=Eumeta variegata TaxID=151549 RepID=A0A4C1WDW8_EUMVA|nr:hypothetical protein EVAR_26788_1 [Eumeta japonica]
MRKAFPNAESWILDRKVEKVKRIYLGKIDRLEPSTLAQRGLGTAKGYHHHRDDNIQQLNVIPKARSA